MLYENIVFRTMGDRAVLVELGDEISPLINQGVRQLFVAVERHGIKGVKEIIPGYRSFEVIYDPLTITFSSLKSCILDIQAMMNPSQLPSPKTVEIPVAYGGEYGPDLAGVAAYHQMTEEEVVRLHTQPIYQVYMIGFMPGFPYMGEVPGAIATPRRKTPRTHVPQGSVAIAQKQTGIYSVASPGGWQIVGRTPMTFFDPVAWPPTPLEMGDFVKFFAITEEEMSKWQP